MEIKIKKSDISKGLGLVQSIVERKTTMPILANVLLEAKDKSLSITATDLEVGINGTFPADVISPGKITIHAKSIYDIVRELPDEMIRIKVGGDNWVEIECGRSKFKVVGLSPDEFPALPERGKGEMKKVGSGILADMVEKTAFAMSSDETRYNLNGVYVDSSGKVNENGIRMVATDGHRLSIVDRDLGSKWKLPRGVIVPRKGITEIKKLVESSESEMDIYVDEKHLVVFKDNVMLVVRLIDGQFPPYEQVLPKSSKRIVTVDRNSLVHALKRVSVLSTDRTRGVKFSISPKNLDIYASNPDLGEAREELAVTYKGESFEIGFNARYFLDALNSIDDDTAVLELGDETSPCVLRSEIDRGFTHVIMPMRL